MLKTNGKNSNITFSNAPIILQAVLSKFVRVQNYVNHLSTPPKYIQQTAENVYADSPGKHRMPQ